MFRRLPDLGGNPLRFTIDGRPATARDGDTVAAALLAAGLETCRTTPVSGAPRGPYCMMGVCFECLVTIDGVGNRQGCLVALADGMAVETQRGARSLDGSQPPRSSLEASPSNRPPHPEVPRSGLEGGLQPPPKHLEASFEAELRSAPQDEVASGGKAGGLPS